VNRDRSEGLGFFHYNEKVNSDVSVPVRIVTGMERAERRGAQAMQVRSLPARQARIRFTCFGSGKAFSDDSRQWRIRWGKGDDVNGA